MPYLKYILRNIGILNYLLTKIIDYIISTLYYLSMIRSIESGIIGRGLGFEYLDWIKKNASRFDVQGVAFIKSDGSIKVIASGEDQNLARFAHKIQKGKLFSLIESSYVKWNASNEEFNNFSISY